ncbi:MAG TPA: phosphatase PAP2 family protein [Vicinamibacterales bacterium]|nr:phosphatase PAP2 family protein [Vicinamibacterales bacterium]
MRRFASCLLVVFTVSATPLWAQDTDAVSTAEPKQDESKKEEAPPPPHGSTSWLSLVKDSAGDFVAFPKRPSTWVLLGAGTAAAFAVHPADDYVATHIVGNDTADAVFSLGQWVGSTYVQVGSAAGLWAIGRYVVAPAAGEPRTNKYSEIGFDLIRAQILSQALVQGMKNSFRRDRPTGECCAFPSGHAATAFAMASVLERHFGYRASAPALAAATYVATSRLVDNRHFLSDVTFGAFLGVASGWTVVGSRGHNRLAFAVEPVPVHGGMMIALTRVDN